MIQPHNRTVLSRLVVASRVPSGPKATRLINNNGRVYDPAAKLFQSPDPVLGNHPYNHTNNNPINFTDPTGFEPCDITVSSCYVDNQDASPGQPYDAPHTYRPAAGPNLQEGLPLLSGKAITGTKQSDDTGTVDAAAAATAAPTGQAGEDTTVHSKEKIYRDPHAGAFIQQGSAWGTTSRRFVQQLPIVGLLFQDDAPDSRAYNERRADRAVTELGAHLFVALAHGGIEEHPNVRWGPGARGTAHVRGEVTRPRTMEETGLFEKSLKRGNEIGISSYRNRSAVINEGGPKSVAVEAGPDSTGTVHTHPNGSEHFSNVDIRSFLKFREHRKLFGRSTPDMVHMVVGSRGTTVINESQLGPTLLLPVGVLSSPGEESER